LESAIMINPSIQGITIKYTDPSKTGIRRICISQWIFSFFRVWFGMTTISQRGLEKAATGITRQQHAVGRSWHNYLFLPEKNAVPETSRPCYLRHLERYLAAHPASNLSGNDLSPAFIDRAGTACRVRRSSVRSMSAGRDCTGRCVRCAPYPVAGHSSRTLSVFFRP